MPAFGPNSRPLVLVVVFFFVFHHTAQMFFLTSLVEGNQFLTDGLGQQQWLQHQKGSLPENKPKAKKGEIKHLIL